VEDTEHARPQAASWGRIASLLAVVLAVAAVASTLARLLYGVDFIDEAFYAATAYRFAMGARPFISDLDIHQTAGWLIGPYVRLHLAVFGDTTGIMLSLRLLWAAGNLTAAGMSYRLMKRLVDWRAALLGAAAGFALIPWMIPAPSFNTLPIIFGSIAVSLAGIGLLERSGPTRFVLAGAALAIASIAHPGFSLVALAFVAGVWLVARSWRQPVAVLAGGGAVVAVALLLLSPGFSGIPNVLAVAREVAPILDWGGATSGLGAKALALAGKVGVLVALWPAVWVAVVAGGLQALRRRVPAWLLVALVACIPIGAQPFDTATLVLAMQMMLLAAILAYTARGAEAGETDGTAVHDATGGRVLFFVVSMGLVAATMFALISSTGGTAFGFGAGVVLGPYVALILSRLGDAISSSTFRFGVSPSARSASMLAPLGIVLAGCLLLGTFVVLNANSAYRDEIPSALTTMVRRGPQAGLLTTAPMARDSEALWTAMQRLTKPGTRVLAYHGLPAAYLFTSGTPATSLMWLANWDALGAPKVTQRAVAEMSRPGHEPDIVVQNLGLPSLWVLSFQAVSGYDPKRDAVEAFVERGYRQVVRGDRWRILAPVGPK